MLRSCRYLSCFMETDFPSLQERTQRHEEQLPLSAVFPLSWEPAVSRRLHTSPA